MDAEELLVLDYEWERWARPAQLAPTDRAWKYWLIKAGRGFGKTRSGAEWVRQQVEAGKRRIALVGPTAADARDVMVEGESGILAISPPWNRPHYEPSKRRLTWPNGALATLYSAEEPERLRGPQHDACWSDELGAWKYIQETWDQIQFGLRLGDDPRICITTTPKPKPLIKQLVADPDCVVTEGRTIDNAANLAPSFMATVQKRYAGTRLGRQELDAELLDDTPGALWTYEMLEKARQKGRVIPQMTRITIGVDPSGSDGETGDSQGIVVCGLGADGRGYVLQDGSAKLSPDGWGQRVGALFVTHKADRVAAEKNYGGDMVRFVLETAAPNIPVTLVSASRGKHLRAEPVSALYEQGRITHLEPFVDLEDQMVLMTSTGYTGPDSPDRLDALVWAFTELFLEDNGQGWIDWLAEQAAEANGVAAKGVPQALIDMHAPKPEPEVVIKVAMKAPPLCSQLELSNGSKYPVGSDRVFMAKAEDVPALERASCIRIEVTDG
jgi:phage terminase large subunit-like protein